MKSKIFKTFVIWLILTCIATLTDWGITQYRTYRHNMTNWITITFYDEHKYGVIKEPIVIKIHPGENVEFPKLEEQIDNASGYLGWETYYYSEKDGERHSRSVREDEKFSESIEIFPVYSYIYSPHNDYEGIPYYENK